MLESILNLVMFCMALACAVVWIVSLAKWDGKNHCEKSGCHECPYYQLCEEAEDPEEINNKQEK